MRSEDRGVLEHMGRSVGADSTGQPLPGAGEHINNRILVGRQELCFVCAGEWKPWCGAFCRVFEVDRNAESEAKHPQK